MHHLGNNSTQWFTACTPKLVDVGRSKSTRFRLLSVYKISVIDELQNAWRVSRILNPDHWNCSLHNKQKFNMNEHYSGHFEDFRWLKLTILKDWNWSKRDKLEYAQQLTLNSELRLQRRATCGWTLGLLSGWLNWLTHRCPRGRVKTAPMLFVNNFFPMNSLLDPFVSRVPKTMTPSKSW